MAGQFLSRLVPNEKRATILALYGNLGAGKTTFIQGLAKALGIKGQIISPTFVIEKIYRAPKSAKSFFKNLIHIDAYRLDTGGDLLKLGFAELVQDPKNLVALEWSERVENIFPENIHKIYLEFIDEQTRKIKF